MNYHYTATDQHSNTVTGDIEATTKEQAIKQLRLQGLTPVIVRQASAKRARLSLKRKSVKHKDLVVFTRQLSTMVSAGVALNRSLATLQNEADNEYFKTIIAAVAKDVQAGTPLGDALEKHPETFSEVYINMVKAGEAGGILDKILLRLAEQIEQEASMRKKLKSAMTYPVVILTVTIFAFFGIMLFIIPKISAIMKDLGGENAKLPIYTQVMMNMSDFLRTYFIFIALVIGTAIYFLLKYIRTPAGKYKFHALLLRVPILRTLIIKIAIARFSRTFASLMAAGVGVLDALEVTGGAIGNKVIEAELKAAAKEVKNGKQLSEPLSKSSHFPAIVGQMLAVGEETGKIDEVLVKVADFYEEEVKAVIDGLSSIIEPLMIIVLGAVVGLIAASVMGPIANLSKNIGN